MIWIKRRAAPKLQQTIKVPSRSRFGAPFHVMLNSSANRFPNAMPKKFRIISQAAPVSGKTKLDVHKALLKLNLKPEQIQLLLHKPLVIKKGLENAAALEYAERFSSAGLKVRIEAYEVAAPAEVSGEGKQRDQLYDSLMKSFSKAVLPADVSRSSISGTAPLRALPAPLAYGSLVLLYSFALLWYLGSGHSLIFGALTLPSAAAIPLWLLTWLLPALVGAGLLICLLYPFWPQRIPAPKLRLDPKRHARFHHLINQMTAAMDVAAPEFVEITSGAGIEVAPARGMRSLNEGDLRLTLGLAAIQNCTVNQLLGLVAHEFGRFSSPQATRAAITADSVNHWFTLHSSTPAEWDKRFDEWTEAYPGKPTRWGIGLMRNLTIRVRQLLGRLATLNTKSTLETMQRLEEDADRYQLSISGNAEFKHAAAKKTALEEAEREVRHINRLALFQRDQLLRDLPAAITFMVENPTPANPNNHATSPATTATVNGAAETGLISFSVPATILFDDFSQLCDNATLHEYHREGIADAEQLRVDNSKILNDRSLLISQSRIAAIQEGERAAINADGSVEWTQR